MAAEMSRFSIRNPPMSLSLSYTIATIMTGSLSLLVLVTDSCKVYEQKIADPLPGQVFLYVGKIINV